MLEFPRYTGLVALHGAYRRSVDVSRGGLRRTCPERRVRGRDVQHAVFSIEVLNGGAAAGRVTFAKDFLKVGPASQGRMPESGRGRRN
jgi:hypothetical protein